MILGASRTAPACGYGAVPKEARTCRYALTSRVSRCPSRGGSQNFGQADQIVGRKRQRHRHRCGCAHPVGERGDIKLDAFAGMLIAAHAMALDYTMVTDNQREF